MERGDAAPSRHDRQGRRLAIRAGFGVYDLGVSLAAWGVLAPTEVARLALGRARRGDLGERLGRRPPTRSHAPARWIVHAVSAGEVAAAGPLIAALGDRLPAASFVLTTGNALGREAAERLRKLLPAIEAVGYLPWDRAGALRRWLASLAPQAVVVVETEIWPNLFRACRELGVPLFIVNGRLYPGDVGRYGWARRFFAEVLMAARWIGVLDAPERDAFIEIGAPSERVEVAGNLKFDIEARPDQIAEPWQRALARSAERPLIVAGSTHHPEERWLLESYARARQACPGLRIAIAPRHVRRCARVQRLARGLGFAATLWSRPELAQERWEVLLVDEIGPLAGLYGFADVAFVGGSLVRRGGHNPLEAAAQRCPVLMGPSAEHFGDLVRGLREVGALSVVERSAATSRSLDRELSRVLTSARVREAMGAQAFAFWQAGRGVAARYAEALLVRCARSPHATSDLLREPGPTSAPAAAKGPMP